jgi:hypothetical protein
MSGITADLDAEPISIVPQHLVGESEVGIFPKLAEWHEYFRGDGSSVNINVR